MAGFHLTLIGRFCPTPEALVYVTATQLAVTVPYSVAGLEKTAMTITSKGVTSVPITLTVVDSVPAIFTADASGTGQAAALNQDFQRQWPLESSDHWLNCRAVWYRRRLADHRCLAAAHLASFGDSRRSAGPGPVRKHCSCPRPRGVAVQCADSDRCHPWAIGSSCDHGWHRGQQHSNGCDSIDYTSVNWPFEEMARLSSFIRKQNWLVNVSIRSSSGRRAAWPRLE